MKDGIHAVLRLGAHLPGGDRRRSGEGRRKREDGGGISGGHCGQRPHDLQLTGGLARQIEQARKTAGAKAAEREFEQDSRLAVAGRSFEKQRGVALKAAGLISRAAACGRGSMAFIVPAKRGEQLGLNGFLPGAQHGKGRVELQASQPLARPELQFEKIDQPLKLDAEAMLVVRREHDGLGDAGAELHKDEFCPQGGSARELQAGRRPAQFFGSGIPAVEGRKSRVESQRMCLDFRAIGPNGGLRGLVGRSALVTRPSTAGVPLS